MKRTAHTRNPIDLANPNLGAVGGLLIGAMSGYLYGLFKEKRSMNEFEKAAVVFMGLLCGKIQELTADNERLGKELAKSRTASSLQGEITALRQERDDLQRRVNELEAQLPKSKSGRAKPYT